MIKRKLSPYLKKIAQEYPVLTVTGPRQSGKTTLVRHLFKNFEYKNLEDPEQRIFAEQDPKRFLSYKGKGLIIDEFQRVPQLASYIQVIVDEKQRNNQFVLTGSQQLEISQTVSQSLSGRTAVAKLLPFSYDEIYKKDIIPIEETIFTGFYPRIHDKKLSIPIAYSSYVQTYIERDLQQLASIQNLSLFQSFLSLCASEIGQPINKSRMGNDIGVDHKTIDSWLSILQASFIIFLLPPHFKNFRKRIIKAPRLYFYDVGLASNLLKINKPQDFWVHPKKGALFENFVIGEVLKNRYHTLESNNLFYFRDQNGNEVDLIIDNGSHFTAIEIKLGSTFNMSFLKGLNFYKNLNSDTNETYVVYGGETQQEIHEHKIIPYYKANYF